MCEMVNTLFHQNGAGAQGRQNFTTFHWL